MFDSLGTNRAKPNMDGNFRLGGKKSVTNSNYIPSSPEPTSARSHGSNRGGNGSLSSNGASIVYNSPAPVMNYNMNNNNNNSNNMMMMHSGNSGSVGSAPYQPNLPNQPNVDASHINPQAPACAKDVFVLSQQVIGTYQYFQTMHGYLDALSGYTQQSLMNTNRNIQEQVQNGGDMLTKNLQQQLQMTHDSVLQQIPQICESICSRIVQQTVQPQLQGQTQHIQDLEYQLQQQQSIISKEFQNIQDRIHHVEQNTQDLRGDQRSVQDQQSQQQNTVEEQVQGCYQAQNNGDNNLQQQVDSIVPNFHNLMEEKQMYVQDQTSMQNNMMQAMQATLEKQDKEEEEQKLQVQMVPDCLQRTSVQEHKVDGIIREISVMYDKVQKLQKFVLLGKTGGNTNNTTNTNNNNNNNGNNTILTDIYGDGGVSMPMDTLYLPEAEELGSNNNDNQVDSSLDEYSGYTHVNNMDALLSKVSEIQQEVLEYKKEMQADHATHTVMVNSRIVELLGHVEQNKNMVELQNTRLKEEFENISEKVEMSIRDCKMSVEQGKEDMKQYNQKEVHAQRQEVFPLLVKEGILAHVEYSNKNVEQVKESIVKINKSLDTSLLQQKDLDRLDKEATVYKKDALEQKKKEEEYQQKLTSLEQECMSNKKDITDLQEQNSLKNTKKKSSKMVNNEEVEQDIKELKQQNAGMLLTLQACEARVGVYKGQIDTIDKELHDYIKSRQSKLGREDSMDVFQEEMDAVADSQRDSIQQQRVEVETTRYDVDNLQMQVTTVTRRGSIASNPSQDRVTSPSMSQHADMKAIQDKLRFLEMELQHANVNNSKNNSKSNGGPPDPVLLHMLDNLRIQVNTFEEVDLVALKESIGSHTTELHARVDNLEIDIAKLRGMKPTSTNTVILEQQELQKHWQEQFVSFEALLGEVSSSQRKQEASSIVMQEHMNEYKEQQCNVQIEVEEAGLVSQEQVQKIQKLTTDLHNREEPVALLREELGVVRADQAYLQRLVLAKQSPQKPLLLPKDVISSKDGIQSTSRGSINVKNQDGIASSRGNSISLKSPQQQRTGGGYKV